MKALATVKSKTPEPASKGHARSPRGAPRAEEDDRRVFDLIARHRATMEAMNRDDHDPVPKRLLNAEIAAARALLETVPQTARGLLSMIRYAADEKKLGLEGYGNYDRFFSSIEKAIYNLCACGQRPSKRRWKETYGIVRSR
jgi:hypothetical protein